ncbi:MAG: hypothetical protein HKN07_14315 [Acidimicrobiia bacterium]|nr:hypothetical protein [Acidimicrobiia bacterium]
MLSPATDGAKVLRLYLLPFRPSSVWSVLLLALFLSGCGVGGNSYEQWEAAEAEYVRSLGPHRLDFPDDAHALAFALASDCFEELPATSELETAVRGACVTLEGDLNELMTMDGLCQWLHDGGKAGGKQRNGEKLCG